MPPPAAPPGDEEEDVPMEEERAPEKWKPMMLPIRQSTGQDKGLGPEDPEMKEASQPRTRTWHGSQRKQCEELRTSGPDMESLEKVELPAPDPNNPEPGLDYLGMKGGTKQQLEGTTSGVTAESTRRSSASHERQRIRRSGDDPEVENGEEEGENGPLIGEAIDLTKEDFVDCISSPPSSGLCPSLNLHSNFPRSCCVHSGGPTSDNILNILSSTQAPPTCCIFNGLQHCL
ncbi:unnamed protein product [Symbiodinium natans]|uniref:Uncharacterized protein n=1 Tax=Symbiodinium natans TaxID=878477 RepID=A0A812K371_9DINO|nr:unnamed protein product [Symbiodinium natans]